MRKRNIRLSIALSTVVCLLGALLLSTPVLAAEAGSIPDGGIYRLKNVGSGKYLNVHNHVDADGTNVYQWTADGSVEQRFLFDYVGAECYYIRAMCSSNGTNRCLTIVKTSSTMSHGDNVIISTLSDTITQFFCMVSAGAQRVYLQVNSATHYVLGVNDNSNGSSGGKSATSAGNVFVQTFTGSDYQKWELEPCNASPTIIDGQYYIKNQYSNRYLSVNGQNVVQKTKTNADTQKWNVVYDDDGFYYLQPVSNLGYRLDVWNAGDSDGVNIWVCGDNGTPAQRFRILPCGNGTYRLAPRCSATRVLSVRGPSMDENVFIELWEHEGDPQQQWTFELISATDPYSALGWSWVFANNQHCRISSGYRTSSRPNHFGIDLSDSTINGTTILSPTSGVVQKRYQKDKSGGHVIVVKTNSMDPYNGTNIRVSFMHMTENSSTLYRHDSVVAGTRIGTVGSTGDSTGPHLHLSVFKGHSDGTEDNWARDATALNPQRFFPQITFTGNVSDTTP